jgi:hypothetical protein
VDKDLERRGRDHGYLRVVEVACTNRSYLVSVLVHRPHDAIAVICLARFHIYLVQRDKVETERRRFRRLYV